MNAQSQPTGPQLGSPVPGTTGGLPALTGLPAGKNPMAQQLQSMGRGEDSMLIHMTPNEVNSLQGLAMAHGGSLTINPHTGLPEAGWLGKLLPTILGIAGAAIGIPTWAIGLGGAGIGTAVTGDLGKGLMIGLGAYGGAGIGNAVGLGGSISQNAFGALGGEAAKSAIPGAVANAGAAATETAKQGLAAATANPAAAASGVASSAPVLNAQAAAAAKGAQGLTQTAAAAKPGFVGAFKDATNIAGTGNVGAIAGGLGVLNNVNEASMPEMAKMPEEEKYNYEGPYVPTERKYIAPTTSARERGGAEHLFFDNANPVPGYRPYKDVAMELAEGGAVRTEKDFGFRSRSADVPPAAAAANMATSPGGKGIMRAAMALRNSPEGAGTNLGGIKGVGRSMAPATRPTATRPTATKVAAQPFVRGRERDFGFRSGSTPAMARGGEVELSNGSFVLDARTVSEIGNGSSNAGMEALRKLGGKPVQGPGDGVSDDVPARIDRKHAARVARDEVVVPADAVKRLGKGDQKRGADKLYELMNKAHKARKKAKRGQDTGLRRGLA